MGDNQEHVCWRTDKFDSIEGRLNTVEERLDNLESIKEAVTRLTTLAEVSHEQNRERDGLIRQQSDALVNVKEFIAEQKVILEKMNAKIDKTDNKVEELSQKMENHNLETVKIFSFDVWGFIKTKAIPALLGAGVVYFLLNANKIFK